MGANSPLVWIVFFDRLIISNVDKGREMERERERKGEKKRERERVNCRKARRGAREKEKNM